MALAGPESGWPCAHAILGLKSTGQIWPVVDRELVITRARAVRRIAKKILASLLKTALLNLLMRVSQNFLKSTIFIN